MQQSFKQHLEDALKSFDGLVLLSEEEFKEAIGKSLVFPMYDPMMEALLEAAMAIKMQYVQLYVMGKLQAEKEVAPNGLGPQTLINPYDRGND